ncbi:MAG TPA: NAD+ synthase [Spirochaetota bacterium]|nr:NAD+ synthase [Spirochaetota bacterium]HPI90414.1 NAD+ synthase [Spirochaetota bacterium]HPR46540.1 NAD+ synthase [Spirochaetota bacterium]
MKTAIIQINPTVADIQGNREKIISGISRARDEGADLAIFSEMATIGYPPLDMLENRKLIRDNLESIELIAREARGIAVLCGYVDADIERPPLLFNAAAFMADGEIKHRAYKTLLPTYDVFDELRYFSHARSHEVIPFMGRKIGVTLCEDIWNVFFLSESRYMEMRRYDADPVRVLADRGADLIINISASPFVKGKNRAKREMLSRLAREYKVSVMYVNQAGGNDSLVFDGNSLCFDSGGRLIGRGRGFEEDFFILDDERPVPVEVEDDEIEDVRRALVMGVRDYVRKCGFSKVIIGLSGGIDSALTAAIAVEALGPENVTGITMPSMYSSRGSVDDSVALAKNLGIRIEEIPIKGLFDRFREDLAPLFCGLPEDVTEENIQARIRGNLLMAVSNKTGALLLTTGNKSELAMGYCTLYGDMSGGLAVISDLPKTLVYTLSRHINRNGEIIPTATIDKPPSAELRPNQKDQDSLPPYDILDAILEMYIEDRKSSQEIIAAGFDPETVRRVLRAVNINEYKRLQAAPGIKVTTKAFGIGRRIPIAQRFVP